MSLEPPIPLFFALKERLRTQVYPDRAQLGAAACAEFVQSLKQKLQLQQEVRIVFAAAPSQNEFLDAVADEPDIDWSRVTAFHMDEYIGLPPHAPQRFSAYLTERLFAKVRPGHVHLLDPGARGQEEAPRYEELLREAPIDFVCLGIGENGHIAFNDPPVADFSDPLWVKEVELDLSCRMQQVNDGCFPSLEEVPTRALTLTIPALMSASRLFCMVPGERKRQAVERTINGPISTECPASILRQHEFCTLYTDADSFGYSSETGE
ncbi:glucosamine-6-phosphate deaminase [Cohnella fermenti]|uniref:Glucosamine-6-phosphate deaminase n=1 Tax=Cohnella fermenti TaxID=2565925 RepID=A0A4S4C9P6_9BACL|nr:glucosamine-6-phosphate deaminase [Cohnella fermenti]THF84467.1 glucosamine-6-phosphate deaminase [Cohnella fermenti]